MVSIKKIKSKKRISFKDLFSDENALIDQFIKSNTLLNTISLVGLFIVFQYLFSQIRFFIPDNPVACNDANIWHFIGRRIVWSKINFTFDFFIHDNRYYWSTCFSKSQWRN